MHISLFEALRASAVKKVVYPCLTEHFSHSPDGAPFVAELLVSQVPVFHRTHFGTSCCQGSWGLGQGARLDDS